MLSKNRFQIEWHCRRGMLELDNLIMPFFKQHFDTLNPSEQATFTRLLACTDLQLFSWFFNEKPADDDALQQMVAFIRSKMEK